MASAEHCFRKFSNTDSKILLSKMDSSDKYFTVHMIHYTDYLLYENLDVKLHLKKEKTVPYN